MPDFTFTSPEGKQYTVTGPQGATKEQAFAKLQEGLKSGAIKTDAPKTSKPEDKGYVQGVKDADKATREAINKPGDSYATGVGKAALGAGETALGMAGGVVGDVADAAVSTATQNSKWGDKVKGAVTKLTAPRTDAGKAITGEVGAVTKPLADLFEYIPKALEEAGHPIAAKDLRAILDVAGGEEAVAGKGIKAVVKDVSAADKAAIAADVEKAASTPKRDAAVAGQSAGYRLAGSETNPSLKTKAADAYADKSEVRNTNSNHNQKVTDNLVRKNFNLPADKPITKDALNKVRQKAGQEGYQALKDIKAPTMIVNEGTAVGEAYHKALDKISDKLVNGIRDQTNNPIVKTIRELKSKDSFSVSDALSEISSLRDDAEKAGANRDRSTAAAYRNAATAVENAIADHLQATGESPKLIESYRDNRKTIAQTYDIEKSLDADGHVDATKLARKPDRLTGDLKTIAQVGQHFAKDVKTPKRLEGSQGSLRDYVRETGKLVTHGGVGAGIGFHVAGPAGAIAGAVAEKAVQASAKKYLTSERYNTKGAGKARTAAEETSRRAMGEQKWKEKKRRLLSAAAYSDVVGTAGEETGD